MVALFGFQRAKLALRGADDLGDNLDDPPAAHRIAVVSYQAELRVEASSPMS
jgi:hypothetical protein